MLVQTISCTRTAFAPTVLGLGAKSTSAPCASRFFPSLFSNTARSTSLLQPAHQQQNRSVSQRTIASRSFVCISSSRTLVSRRHPYKSSTSRSRSHAVSTSTQTTTPLPPTSPSTQALSWNTYLSLRQKRRYYGLTSSLITGFGTFAGGVSFLMNQDLEKLSGILFGIDPVMALGAGGIAFGVLGWLAGPFAGEAVFRIVYRRVWAQMEVKEKDFYHRVKKYRCDPSAQSVSNPVPDYYGEKISSVKGYRQWLKDQRAFRKKRETPPF